MPICAFGLLERIWEQVLLRSNEEISELIRRPSGVLFDAAMSGNVEFLAVLLCKYPDLLWEVNEKKQSVFHVAVLHRQVHVFNLIYNIAAVKDYIVGNIDIDQNNMLHLAGKLPHVERLGAPRANLQMQRELLWFKVFFFFLLNGSRYSLPLPRSVIFPFQFFLEISYNLLWKLKEWFSYSYEWIEPYVTISAI